MDEKYKKLKTLLLELFQLDQPDLDFGLYRVLHAPRMLRAIGGGVSLWGPVKSPGDVHAAINERHPATIPRDIRRIVVS